MFTAMLTRAIALLAFACLVGLTAGAAAQIPAIVGGSGDWIAYRFEEGGVSTCYLASQPKEARGDYTDRGEIWTLVTYRAPGDGAAVVSITPGYKYKEGSAVKVTIGDAAFELFTQSDTAWTNTIEDDARLIEAMKKGSKMVVTGVSWRGTETIDTYSLSGFTNTYGDVRKSCGL